MFMKDEKEFEFDDDIELNDDSVKEVEEFDLDELLDDDNPFTDSQSVGNSKVSKYKRVSGWEDGDGFLTPEQIKILIEDEENSRQVTAEHPLSNIGLERAYRNIRATDIHPDDLDNIN